ncbi:MAG: hypothetical protein HDT35_02340 [Clostridiales bacterium]|nr:hypothetical protein [Clostridiales bacterium]
MEKFLTILEVSQKQAYIFASKRLKENAARSGDIERVTGSAFFARTAADWYREEDNLVYAGGGHTVLQFEAEDQAKGFARAVTEAVLREYPGLELFVKTIPHNFDPARTPGDNLKELSKELERKKARRTASFRVADFGLEAAEEEEDRPKSRTEDGLRPPEGYQFPAEFEELPKAIPADRQNRADNFIAVIHIDGNAMGARVEDIYRCCAGDWESCRAALRKFSEGIQQDFESAFHDTVAEVIQVFRPGKNLPIRPVILAGDDVCFVTAGSIGLECARVFLEKLSRRANAQQPDQPYAACAGVALVHTKYPFYRAYELAEELCSNAKRYGASLDAAGRVSAMDWHIEFGQLKDSLSLLREDYRTEDGCRLELRPVTVIVPEDGQQPPPERTYGYFRALCGAMKREQGKIARSKVKELRTALKQGEVEGEFFLQEKEIGDLLYHPLETAYALEEWSRELDRKGAFRTFRERAGETRRCLFFDAIEMLDHFIPFEEVSQ